MIPRLSSASISARLSFLFLVAALAAAVPSLQAQQTGTLTGRVIEGQSGQAVPSVQIYIEGQDVGVLTQANGRYLLQNVPAGTHTVTAERIGYRTATAEVSVGAGETAVQNFTLTEEALQLDEVIVTGTAGGSQRRAVGNAVSQVQASELNSQVPINTVEDALMGRTPGVHLSAPNSAGAGSKIRIRGHSSIGLAGDPIIYVDGVRLNDNRTQVGRYSTQSRLADFDPNNIESIEIIKGPAAATLYGTEASDGVIQIVTKSGQEGSPVFDFSVELGNNWFPDNEFTRRTAWIPDPNQCASVPCQSVDELIAFNVADHNKMLGFGETFQNGLTQKYNAAVRGGTDLIRYSFSLTRSDQEGVVSWNSDERNEARMSLEVTPSERLTISVDGGYNQGEYHPPEFFWGANFGWGGRPTSAIDSDGNFNTGFLEQRGWRNGGPQRFDPVRYNNANFTKRSTWSLRTEFENTDWLSHRLTVGLDQVYERDEQFDKKEGISYFHGSDGLRGEKSVNTLDAPVWTVDFAGTATLRFMEDMLGTATSYGVQYYSREALRTSASGEDFAVGALSTVSAASVREAGETFVENKTFGVYLQEQFDWDNRIFFTAAIRADDNSAFGENFDIATYPKVSATWVMSEEQFWNVDWIDQLRLRSAWGQAGKQPDAFAANRLYTPETGPGSAPILSPSQFGNPDLGPEVGEELEVGFDASVFDGRVAVDFTYYNRKTKDAIVGRTVPPSLWPGGAGAFSGGIQLVNIGEVSAWGTETSLSLQAIREGPVQWNVDVAFTTQGNEIKDMGGIDRIQVGRTRAHYEGFSIAALSDKRVISADFVSGDRGPVTNVMCDGGAGKKGLEFGGPPVPCDDAPRLVWGPTDPQQMLNVTSTWTLFDNWRASVNIDGQFGHMMGSDYMGARHTSHPSSQLVWLQDDPIGQAYRGVTRNGLSFHDAGFIKVREIALSYSLPSVLVDRIGASSASIRVGARNLWQPWRAQDYIGREPIADSEMTRGNFIFAGEDGGGWPPIKSFTTRVAVQF